jgi:hypothetical protein
MFISVELQRRERGTEKILKKKIAKESSQVWKKTKTYKLKKVSQYQIG